MTMQQLLDRWHVLLEKKDKFVGEYPPTLEPLVKRAVQEKRCGFYLEAIDTYLSIMERNNACYYDLLVSMYKTVLCTGCFHFAYELIAVSEIMVKIKKGNNPAPHPLFPFLQTGKWQQTELRHELEKLLIRNQDYSKLTDTSSKEYIDTGKKVLADFENTIKPYSGRDDYFLLYGAGARLQEEIAFGMRAMIDWRNYQGQYLC